jgi:hypothetical protein
LNHKLLSVLVGLMCLSVLAGSAYAGTWYILPDGSGVVPTIQAGIDTAVTGDTLLLAAGTYTGPGNRGMDFGGKELVLTSETGAAATIIDCENLGGAFVIQNGEGPGLVITGITVTNARVGAAQTRAPESRAIDDILLAESALVFGAAVNVVNGSPVIRGNVFTHCTATVAGAIYVGVGTPWIDGNTIGYCSAGYGGGVYFGPSSDPLIENNTIEYCEASNGGGIYCNTNGEVLSNDIRFCSATGQGGGLFCNTGSATRVAFNTIQGNHAEEILVNGAGGGMYCAQGSAVTIRGNLFFANEITDQATGAGLALYQCGGHVLSNTFRENFGVHEGWLNTLGGGLYANDYTGLVENNEFDANVSGGGAGAWIQGSAVNPTVLRGNVFRNHEVRSINPIGVEGMAYALQAYYLILEDCSFINNLTGGACLTERSEISGCVFSGNWRHGTEGPAAGGGLKTVVASHVTHCVFYGNSADVGGGLYIAGTVTETQSQIPRVEYCTFSDNRGQAANISTNLTSSAWPVIIANCIFAFGEMEGTGHCTGFPPTYTCCNIYQTVSPWCYNDGGGNISADPWFCSRGNGNYELALDSPCAPANNGCGEQIGALGVGCGPVPVMFAAVHATAHKGAVEIRWDLIADEPVAGFDIYRSAGVSDKELRLNTAGPVAPGERTYRDKSVRPSTGYTYRVVAVTPDGAELSSRTATVTTRPGRLALEQNTPNPFNPSTSIRYTLPAESPVEINVYDARGKRVTTLVSAVQNAGPHDTVWNGRDHRGQPAGSGVYFVKLTAGKRTLTRKMLLLK